LHCPQMLEIAKVCFSFTLFLNENDFVECSEARILRILGAGTKRF